MSKFPCWNWRVAFLICAIIMTSVLSGNTVCLAKNQTTLPIHKHKTQQKPKKKYDKTALQIQQMQKMLNAYSQRLQEMQSTVATLKAQINKDQPIASDSTTNSKLKDVVNKKNIEPQIAATSDEATTQSEDISNQLIFGSEEQAQASDTAIKNVSTLAGRIQSDPTTSNPSKEFSGRVGHSFNPDIIVSGDFLGNVSRKSNSTDRNRLGLREAEFGFSSAIDPYSRGTVVFAKPENESLEIEEGYITLLNLPFGLQSKVGKFRSDFGKLNSVHGHDLPQTDRPDVLTNFLGEEGLVETGISVSKILPTSWYSDINFELANGDSQPLFGHGRLDKPVIMSHWKNFFNISEDKSFEVGLSNALGSRDEIDRSRISAIQGIDLTYNWIPSNQLHSLKWQSELLAAELGQGNFDEESLINNKKAYFGGYSFLEYKINNRWSAGARVDYSQIPLLSDASEWAAAPYVDYALSEFGKLRLEYKHTFGHNFESSDKAWLQYSVIMGTHPPHTL